MHSVVDDQTWLLRLMMVWGVFFHNQFVGFCQSTSWQCAMHTVSKERGGDYRAMASCQGVLRVRVERE